MIPIFFAEGSKDTPQIKFDSEKNQFEITGRSMPEDAVGYFEPVFEWLEQYSKTPNQTTTVEIFLEIMSSSSAKQIGKMLDKFRQIDTKIKIIWRYYADDPDMYESGKRFERLTNLTFEFSKETPPQQSDEDLKKYM